MFCVAITLIAKPGRESDIEALFRDYVPIAEGLPGAIRFEVHRATDAPRAFLLDELYEDRAALLAHRDDAVFKTWRPRIAELEESRTLREFDTLIASR